MADEHKQQAAALLAEADEIHITVYVHRDPPDEFERRAVVERQRQRDLRQEALVHATLQVADEISLLIATFRR